MLGRLLLAAALVTSLAGCTQPERKVSVHKPTTATVSSSPNNCFDSPERTKDDPESVRVNNAIAKEGFIYNFCFGYRTVWANNTYTLRLLYNKWVDLLRETNNTFFCSFSGADPELELAKKIHAEEVALYRQAKTRVHWIVTREHINVRGNKVHVFCSASTFS